MDINAYNCLGILLAKAAVQLGTSYQMMVKGGWTFSYDKSLEGIVGSKITCQQRYDLLESLEKYHEVAVTKYELDKSTFITQVDCWLFEHVPVIVNTDSFWCHWSFAYQRRHYLHSFMVTGVHAVDSVLVCQDPYITEKTIYVPLDDVYPGIRHCFTIHKKSNSVEPYLMMTVLREDVNQLLKDGAITFNNIHVFADAMKSIDMAAECQEYKDALYAAPIFERLKSVTCSRRGYAYMIQYIAGMYHDSDMANLSERLFRISRTWEEIRGRLIRCYLRGNNQDIHPISDAIHQIAEDELFLVDSLSQFLCNKYY